MRIEFDADKDAANRVKHGVSLAAAADIHLGKAVVVEDRRFDYGEARFIAYAPLQERLHVLWYTWRDGICRVIGLGKANEREGNAMTTSLKNPPVRLMPR